MLFNVSLVCYLKAFDVVRGLLHVFNFKYIQLKVTQICTHYEFVTWNHSGQDYIFNVHVSIEQLCVLFCLFVLLFKIFASFIYLFFKVLLNFLQYSFCLMFWFFGLEARGFLAPDQGWTHTPSIGGQVFTTGQPGKSLNQEV